MRSRNGFVFLLALLAIGAFAFRQPDLGNRPMHGDEAVHAFKFRDIWQHGVYRYDPNEFHGPTIYYAALPSVWLHGRRNFAATTEADYRLPIAVIGALMVLALAPLADGIGRRSTLWAALLTALSPAFVFYSRYFIQEVPLACFTLGALACGWRYARDRRLNWLVGCGVCAGLMIASKETAVFTFAAVAVALPLTALWTRSVDRRTPDLRALWGRRNRALLPALSLLFGVCLLTACLFLSGFATNPRGPLDYLRAYAPWLNRAHGTDLHRHPWNYYLQILIWSREGHGPIWSEGLIVCLALIGAVVALLPDRQFRDHIQAEANPACVRFLAFYTVTLTGIYSVIPYKTPWCLLSFLSGMILLAGVGATSLINLLPGKLARATIILLLFAGCAQLGWQSYRTSYVAYTDPRNPYVYAQPVPDMENLAQQIEDLSHVSPQGHQMVIKVFSVDNYYWPLPWYLRAFPNIGYWNEVPSDADAPVVLASPEFDDLLQKRLNDTHLMHGYFGVRSGVFLEYWVRLDLWTKHIAARKAKRAPDAGE